jgi:hypothetical protein
MQEAEILLHQHVDELPNEIVKQLFSGVKLSTEDRETILSITQNVLASFQTES